MMPGFIEECHSTGPCHCAESEDMPRDGPDQTRVLPDGRTWTMPKRHWEIVAMGDHAESKPKRDPWSLEPIDLGAGKWLLIHPSGEPEIVYFPAKPEKAKEETARWIEGLGLIEENSENLRLHLRNQSSCGDIYSQTRSHVHEDEEDETPRLDPWQRGQPATWADPIFAPQSVGSRYNESRQVREGGP
jgi:hypothetical protein